MLEMFDNMVEHEECEEWFQLKCMGLEEDKLWYFRKCAH